MTWTRSISVRAAATSSATFASTTCEPSKMSSYSSRSDSKASTCWSRRDHCWSQRPGQPERLVPGGEWMARAGRSCQRDAEHLQHDALHVVLGLGLGQAERVDLDAVAEPAHLRVRDAVPLLGQLVPQLHERAHLAHLLDEPHAGVDEERDAADDLAELVLRHLARVPHRVEHGDRRAQRVGQLLLRCGAGLLQVVAADVDGVPLRHLVDRVGDDVSDQPQRVLGREHVGAAGEVLLDDVVLGGARELMGDLGRVEREACSSATTW